MPDWQWRDLPAELGDDELTAWTGSIARPVALTGSTGFIGSHVVDALVRAGIRPRLLVRDSSRLLVPAEAVEIVKGDVTEHVALERLVQDAATVIHLAGVVRAPTAVEFERVNRGGCEKLVAALGVASPTARLVHVSSLSAAGPSDDPRGRSPELAPAPISAYGRSKLAGERAIASYHGPWVILRPPAVYGPRDIDILQFFRLVARGLVPLPAGERYVTMAFVADVVRAVLAAAAGCQSGRVYHLGDVRPFRTEELITLLAHTGDVRARVVRIAPAVVRLAGWCGDRMQNLGFHRVAMTSDKATELLARHWTARTQESLAELGLPGGTAFVDGARVTWSWYRLHGQVPHAKMRRV
jgi:nucleoside-diphosphate-sugar epimerase